MVCTATKARERAEVTRVEFTCGHHICIQSNVVGSREHVRCSQNSSNGNTAPKLDGCAQKRWCAQCGNNVLDRSRHSLNMFGRARWGLAVSQHNMEENDQGKFGRGHWDRPIRKRYSIRAKVLRRTQMVEMPKWQGRPNWPIEVVGFGGEFQLDIPSPIEPMLVSAWNHSPLCNNWLWSVIMRTLKQTCTHACSNPYVHNT